MPESTTLDRLKAALKTEHEEVKNRLLRYEDWAETVISFEEGRGPAPTVREYQQWRQEATRGIQPESSNRVAQ